MQSSLTIGRVLSSHGLRGEVKIESFSGEEDHIRSLRKASLIVDGQEREHGVINVRGSGKNLIVLFDGIDSPEKAKEYCGAEISVHRRYAAPLKEGEYYFADLVHCKVFFEKEHCGSVCSVWKNGHCDMLEIVCLDGHVAHVPLQDHFVSRVDVDERVIELNMDWILE